MTHQEIFDKILASIREQGQPSLATGAGGTLACRYRGPNGLKCAVGHLIADEHYDPEIEGKAIDYRLGKILAASGIPVDPDTIRLLRLCQMAHDNPGRDSFLIGFNNNMKEVAHDFGLEYMP